jgi:hypothetical protein
MKEIDFCIYSASCLKKSNDIEMERVLDFIKLIQNIEIDDKYKPFDKPWINLTERKDFEEKIPSIREEFLVVDKII